MEHNLRWKKGKSHDFHNSSNLKSKSLWKKRAVKVSFFLKFILVQLVINGDFKIYYISSFCQYYEEKTIIFLFFLLLMQY